MSRILLYIFLFLNIAPVTAQSYKYYKEIGLAAGPSWFKSDYGQRGNYENFQKNDGFSVSALYYLSPLEDFRTFRENFKLKLEASYSKATLNHYGKYVDPSKHSITADQLRAMHGSTQITSVGFIMEYYPFKTDDYYRGMAFTPFIGLGPQLCYYTSKVESNLGPMGTTTTTPPKYMNAYRNDSSIVGSLTGTIGTRFKISYYDAILLEVGAQYFFSDWVDGLNPDKTIYKENKYNDWNATLKVGYIYYFQ